jgi:diguanylate cyclase (GGDEF)-like protein
VFIQGCQLKYKQIPSENFDIQLAEQTVSTTTLNHKQLKELKFNNFKNGSIVDFKEGDNSFVFKIIRNYQSSELQTLLVMPHYLSEVSYVDGDLKNFHTIRRNMYSKDRQYSPNIIAFDLNNENHISYVFVKNTVAKKIQFLVQNRNYVKNYDQKLIITFTSVYSIILTLIFVNLIFFFYIRKISYLYYSFFILTTLFSILFQEGWIAYFQHLSLPIFGIYTRVIWIKLPSLFFWLFVISFLDLKTKSRFDYRLSRVMLFIELFSIAVLLFLSLFDITGIYATIVNIINLYIFLSVFIGLYIPLKYAIQKMPQAIYLASGWSFYLITVWIRIYYSFNLDPMAFWMPRAFEFALMIEAIILSFGLADKTMRIMQQRDVAENSLQKVDRELFCKELNDRFQMRANNTIENYFGSQKELNKIIDWYYTSSLQKLVEIRAVFYVYEQNKIISSKYLSEPIDNFDVNKYIDDNQTFLKKISANKKAVYQNYEVYIERALRFIVIPIENTKAEKLCLFLMLPEHVIINDELLEDLYTLANTMTKTLLSVRKFQKTVESARFDALTHVLNRKSMDIKINDVIKRARLKNNSVAVAFIDVDDFKDINDHFGHEAGDDCLKFLCEELKSELRKDVYIGRFGGDEFIVLFENQSKLEIKQKIENVYSYFNKTPIRDISLRVSIGIAIGTNENKLLRNRELLGAADKALYQAKNNGKNQFTFFDS